MCMTACVCGGGGRTWKRPLRISIRVCNSAHMHTHKHKHTWISSYATLTCPATVFRAQMLAEADAVKEQVVEVQVRVCVCVFTESDESMDQRPAKQPQDSYGSATYGSSVTRAAGVCVCVCVCVCVRALCTALHWRMHCSPDTVCGDHSVCVYAHCLPRYSHALSYSERLLVWARVSVCVCMPDRLSNYQAVSD